MLNEPRAEETCRKLNQGTLQPDCSEPVIKRKSPRQPEAKETACREPRMRMVTHFSSETTQERRQGGTSLKH